MKPVEFGRCMQYAQKMCEELKIDAIKAGAMINIFPKAYESYVFEKHYGIRFNVDFYGIKETYFTGSCDGESELMRGVDEQLTRIKIVYGF